MEVLAALGLAANLLQCIEAGHSLISSAIEVRRSVAGTTAENADLLVIAEQLKRSSDVLKQPPPASVPRNAGSPDSSRDGLRVLLVNCHKLSVELLQLVKSLKVDKKGSSRQSISVAFRTWRKQGDITSIRRRLAEYRGQIVLEINILLRKNQSRIGNDLGQLVESVGEVQDGLNDLREALGKQGSLRGAVSGQTLGEDDLIGIRRELQLISEFRTRMQEAKQRHSILNAIRFDKLEERFEDVRKEHANTFNWIFDGVRRQPSMSRSELTSWRKSGSGIFHIEGKAGFGKSTLMKFICKDPRTMENLKIWAGDKQLVFAQFFFWKPGTPLQRSLKGLTRGLLYHILEQAPELIKSTFPEAWKSMEENPWDAPSKVDLRLVDIQQAFLRLIQDPATYASRRFFFMIDGLDEFDESNGLDPEDHSCYGDMIQLFSNWTRNQADAKLCVSSRDWNLFKEGFSGHPKIRLQDLTKQDMETLVRDTLRNHGGNIGSGMHSLQPVCATQEKSGSSASLENKNKIEIENETKTETGADPGVAQLVDQIVKKAEGVFLWVVLVLKSLRQGFQNRDSAEVLQARLKQMPRGLESFLGFMLESIDPIYLPRSVRIFSLALTANKLSGGMGLSLLRYSFLENLERNPRFAIDEADLASEGQLTERLVQMRSHLDACCHGLLVVQRDPSYPGTSEAILERVTFLHRSVQEFLEEGSEARATNSVPNEGSTPTHKVQRAITASIKSMESPRLMSHTFLALLKSIEPTYSWGLQLEIPAVATAFHQLWLGTVSLYWDLLSAIDRVLLRPQHSIIPKLGDQQGISAYNGRYGFVFNHIRKGGGSTLTFYDLYGTFVALGFAEILGPESWENASQEITSPKARPWDAIGNKQMTPTSLKLGSGRSLNYCLSITLFGADRIRLSPDATYLAMVDLLQRGADPNGLGNWNEGYSLTIWESFIPQLEISGKYPRTSINDSTADLVQLLLEGGANPYAWLIDSEKWFLASYGYIYECGCRQDDSLLSRENIEPLSLRRFIERWRPHNSDSILALLPSESQYRRQWHINRLVMGHMARREVHKVGPYGKILSDYPEQMEAPRDPQSWTDSIDEAETNQRSFSAESEVSGISGVPAESLVLKMTNPEASSESPIQGGISSKSECSLIVGSGSEEANQGRDRIAMTEAFDSDPGTTDKESQRQSGTLQTQLQPQREGDTSGALSPDEQPFGSDASKAEGLILLGKDDGPKGPPKKVARASLPGISSIVAARTIAVLVVGILLAIIFGRTMVPSVGFLGIS